MRIIQYFALGLHQTTKTKQKKRFIIVIQPWASSIYGHKWILTGWLFLWLVFWTFSVLQWNNYANPTLAGSATRGVLQQDNAEQIPQQLSTSSCFSTVFLVEKCQQKTRITSTIARLLNSKVFALNPCCFSWRVYKVFSFHILKIWFFFFFHFM